MGSIRKTRSSSRDRAMVSSRFERKTLSILSKSMPIISMAPLRASLSIFDEVGGMERLRAKSIKLTGYLEFLLMEIGSKKFSVITPGDPNARGCQLSIVAHQHPKELHNELVAAGVKCDFREDRK